MGLIHAKSLTVSNMAQMLMKIDQLRSEDESEGAFQLCRIMEHETIYMINGGEKHPFVDALQKLYDELVLSENGRSVHPPYGMNPTDLETIMGVSLEELEGGREFRKKSEGGYFRERVNGLKQPDELTSRYQEVARVVQKMCGKSIEKRTSPKQAGNKIKPGSVGC